MIKRHLLYKSVSLVFVLIIVCGLLMSACTPKCEHKYRNGVCTLCNYACPHAEYENAVCKECNKRCRHTEYNEGVCTECKTVCPHTNYSEGVCPVCKIVCKHDDYDANGRCEECGTLCNHNFVGNECTVCGTEKFIAPGKPEADYDYVAHLDEELPRIYVSSETFMKDATRYVPSFDNYNPENNIDWQYHNCTVTVNNCAEEYELSVTAGIKVRGNWTTTYDKKPFRIKFDKKQAMLGLNGGAKMKSWVLLADYKDCALERNSVAFYLGQQILGSDGYYCSDFRQVEVYLNNLYWGVYLLAEQQQVNANRINVTEPDDNYTGTDIGYFVEYDGYYQLEKYGERFSSNHGEGYSIKNDVYENENYPEYPAAGNAGRYPQKKFIQNYINNLYTICSGAVKKQYKTFNSDYTALVNYRPSTSQPVQETVSKVIDIQSLVDMYIHCEIACDADIGWSSFFMDVDFGAGANDNLLRFEAPWDFDSAFGFKVGDVADGNGIYAAPRNPWLRLFMDEDWFMNMVKDKWHEMRDAGVQEGTLKLIRTMQTNYSDAYNRNFDKWGFRISDEATWEVQSSVHNHTDAVNQLYSWVQARFKYLNSVWL